LLAAWLTAASLALAKAEVGSPAPDFTLKTTDGQSVTLSQYKGKTVVLEWTNPQCPFVQRHYQEGTMKNLAAKYAGKDVVWLAINSTHSANSDSNALWAKQQQIAYPILDDHDGKVGLLYGAKTTPDMFIIDSTGRLVYEGAIDNDPRGDKSNRVNYVGQALDEVLAGKPIATAQTKSYGCNVKYPD
jgi:peroxiredoxin